MKSRTFLALFVSAILLASCGKTTYSFGNYEDYTKRTLSFSENMRVLQITDSHWGIGSNLDLEEQYITGLVNKANPDIIVLDGDMFMHANRKIVDRFFTLIDSFNIPFCYAYGNHDLQGQYSSTYIDESVKKRTNSLLVNDLNDGLFGRSNYYVNLVDASGNVVWQVLIMDSNSYVTSGHYDIFHEDQVSWYRSIVTETTTRNGNITVPQLAFYHIPGLYFRDALDEYLLTSEGRDNSLCDALDNLSGNGTGCAREDVYHGYADDGIFDVMVELGSTKGIFVGHDHINNFHLDYQGIKLCYNLKAGQNIYHDNRLFGGQVIEIHSDGTFNVERIPLGYEGL